MPSPQEAPSSASADAAIVPPELAEDRPLRGLLIAGSQRRDNSCPGLVSKTRALLQRMAARLPPA